MDRIELRSKMSSEESLPIRALGLIPEFDLSNCDSAADDGQSQRVASISSSNFDSIDWPLLRKVSQSTRNLAMNINLDRDLRKDEWLHLRRVLEGRTMPVYFEISSELLIRDQDRALFELVNRCEELEASAHLRISSYAGNWKIEIMQLLDELAGFVSVLGLPQPIHAASSNSKNATAIADDVQRFVFDVPLESDVSLLCFSTSQVQRSGMLGQSRFWFGL